MTTKTLAERLRENAEDARELDIAPELAVLLDASADALDAKDAEIARLRDEARILREARPEAEWHEDDGPVLWHKFPINEAPWVGTPLDSDWPGYHTDWTPLPPVPEQTF